MKTTGTVNPGGAPTPTTPSELHMWSRANAQGPRVQPASNVSNNTILSMRNLLIGAGTTYGLSLIANAISDTYQICHTTVNKGSSISNPAFAIFELLLSSSTTVCEPVPNIYGTLGSILGELYLPLLASGLAIGLADGPNDTSGKLTNIGLALTLCAIYRFIWSGAFL